MILSVGYRVKSSRGVKFRSWANTVLKQYLLKGYAVNQRIEQLERRVALTEVAREALDNAKYITSIEIAELTGKMHKHVMEAIRKMKPAWESERGTNFRLSQIREKNSNNGYNRLPEVFTKEDVISVYTDVRV